MNLSEAGVYKVDLNGKPCVKVTMEEAMAARLKVAEIKKLMHRNSEPLPSFIEKTAMPKKTAAPLVAFDETAAGLPLNELWAKLQSRLPHVELLLNTPDSEYKTKFLRTVLEDVRSDVATMLYKLDRAA
jgi:hypothetical protein